VVLVEHQCQKLAASAVAADKQPVLQVEHRAPRSAATAATAASLSLEMAASVAWVAPLHRPQEALTPTIARLLSVVLAAPVEHQHLVLAEMVAQVERLSLIATNGRQQPGVTAEMVACPEALAVLKE
jgi:hypothetical protein